jgi:hypothetical protein
VALFVLLMSIEKNGSYKNMKNASLLLISLFISMSSTASMITVDDLDLAMSVETSGGALALVTYDGKGALKMTTVLDNNSKSAYYLVDDSGSFGIFGDLLNQGLDLEYSFLKQADQQGAPIAAAFAAPALTLGLYNESFNGDGYIELKYEHYWNIGNAAVPLETWTVANINSSAGQMWGNGGLDLPNTGGGPRFYSFNDILNGTASSTGLFTSDIPSIDFSSLLSADLVNISVQVGSYNQGQTGYVDYVKMTTDQGSTTWDFQANANQVPEPSSIAILVIALSGFGLVRKRKVQKRLI